MSSKLPLKHGPLFGKKLQMDEDKRAEHLTTSWFFSKRYTQIWSKSDWSWPRASREVVFSSGRAAQLLSGCQGHTPCSHPAAPRACTQNKSTPVPWSPLGAPWVSLGSCFAASPVPPHQGLLTRGHGAGALAELPARAGLCRSSGSIPELQPRPLLCHCSHRVLDLCLVRGGFGHIWHLLFPRVPVPRSQRCPWGERQGIAGLRKKLNASFPYIP